MRGYDKRLRNRVTVGDGGGGIPYLLAVLREERPEADRDEERRLVDLRAPLDGLRPEPHDGLL